MKDSLSNAIELAFYEAEKHKPAKEGHCEKCGFCHCGVGHVLAMAKQKVLEIVCPNGDYRIGKTDL